MADEEKEVKEEAAEEKPAKKSSKLLIIILLIAGLAIGGGGAAVFLVLKNMKSDDKSEVAEEKNAGDEGDDGEKEGMDKLGPIMPLDPFIVNLSGDGGRNYLKLEITLEFDKEVVQVEVENKMPRIKDSILLLLATKSFESIQTAEGKLMLKNEIITRLNRFLSTGVIQNLYFTNFVVQ
jgi:flagellar FliL protein